MRQFCQIALAYFLPWDFPGFTGIEFGDAPGDFGFPGSLNAFVDFAAEVRNKGGGQGFLFFDGKRLCLFEGLGNLRGHLGTENLRDHFIARYGVGVGKQGQFPSCRFRFSTMPNAPR